MFKALLTSNIVHYMATTCVAITVNAVSHKNSSLFIPDLANSAKSKEQPTTQKFTCENIHVGELMSAKPVGILK